MIAPINGFRPKLVSSHRERQIRRHDRSIWLGIVDAYGGRAAPFGVLRSHKSVCKVMKAAEMMGWYD